MGAVSSIFNCALTDVTQRGRKSESERVIGNEGEKPQSQAMNDLTMREKKGTRMNEQNRRNDICCNVGKKLQTIRVLVY